MKFSFVVFFDNPTNTGDKASDQTLCCVYLRFSNCCDSLNHHRTLNFTFVFTLIFILVFTLVFTRVFRWNSQLPFVLFLHCADELHRQLHWKTSSWLQATDTSKRPSQENEVQCLCSWCVYIRFWNYFIFIIPHCTFGLGGGGDYPQQQCWIQQSFVIVLESSW